MLVYDSTRSLINRLVKNKSGDFTDAENYRAIMISNVITKLLEFLLYDKLVTASPENVYQFGFKAVHSTGSNNGLVTGSIARSASRRYLVYSADFEVFRPAGATRCTDGGKIWRDGGDPSFVPNFTPIGATTRV